VDLVNAIREQMASQPEVEFVSSHNPIHGKESSAGVIGQLQRNEVDMSCGRLIVNEGRQNLIEFSQPFMNTSIGIMMMKQGGNDSCFAKLLRPFTCWTWLFIILTFLLLLLARFLLSLLKWKLRKGAPPRYGRTEHSVEESHEHGGPLDHEQESKIRLVKNIRRLLKYVLLGFTLFVLAFYFANLSAQLVAQRVRENSLQSVKDLVKQSDVQYGLVRNGATHQYFRQSNHSSHQQFLENVESQYPNGFVSNYSEGIRRVQESNGNYAFLLESSALDYASRQDCNLYKAGGNVNTINYALAFPIGSPWRTQVNGALQSLQEQGQLEEIRKKWWSANGEDCPTKEDRHRLGWSDLCGLFLLVPLILLLGIVYFVVKHFLGRKVANKRNVTINKHDSKSSDQKKLVKEKNSPIITEKRESPDANRFGPVQPQYVETHTRRDGTEPHVINHPIRIENRPYGGRR